uniref:Ig-like domain-containing protein n=2 Tax=Anabas testudineus TaxID=64144 RepID=A0AAQ6IIC1_ANATE
MHLDFLTILFFFSKLDGHFSTMLKSLFVYGVLGVLLIKVKSNQISVCIEDDNDLRVDCKIQPKPNKINTYEFSWSSGNKMSLLNTNVSGSTAESKFKSKSYVEELEPYGYRLTLKGFTDELPHNTTYMCRMTGEEVSVSLEKGSLVRCSAVSMFLKSSCSWIVCLLLFLYHTHS